jgi:hypothetical protein
MQRKTDDQSRLETLAPAAPTEAPTLAGAAVSRRSWRARGAAAGVIALAIGLAGCGGSSSNDDPPVAEEPPPPPVETPAPPPNVPPPVETPAPPPAADPAPAGFTKTGDILTTAGSIDIGDVFTAGSRTVVFDTVNSRYYELKSGTPVDYATAKAAAATAGGLLASPSDAAKMAFIKVAFQAQLPLGGAATGANGAWIGLEQAPSSPTPGDGWTFLDGTALPGASALWNKPTEPNDAGNATESNSENFGAIFAGKTNVETDLELIYDAGVGATSTQPMYLIEYATKEAIVVTP